MAKPKWVRTWVGGRVKLNRKGDFVWVLERCVLRKRYYKALAAMSEEEALQELEAFDRKAEEVRARARKVRIARNDLLGALARQGEELNYKIARSPSQIRGSES